VNLEKEKVNLEKGKEKVNLEKGKEKVNLEKGKENPEKEDLVKGKARVANFLRLDKK
jgi:hypothetical protein